jgi:Flp pilus assembly protein protease CpaA
MTSLSSTIDLKLLLQLALVAWMAAVSIMDHRSGRIPNWITAPVFLAVGVLRLVFAVLPEQYADWQVDLGFIAKAADSGNPRFMLAFMLIAWVVLFILWMMHFIGGGDAKFLMALYAVFPTWEFTAVLALILLVIMIPLLLLEWRGASLRGAGSGLRARLLTGQILPTRDELQTQGRRYAWTFAIPAMVYTVFYW